MWFQIIAWVVTSVISYLLTPKPKAPAPGNLEAPTTEEGTPIMVLLGSGWIEGPVVAWFGDTRTTAIKSKGGKK